MTKYHIDRMITGAYTGPLAKRHCAALRRANADVDGDDVTECTGRVQTNHFVLLVDRCAESGPNVELCGSDGTDDYDDLSEADDEQPAASMVIWSSD